jgi:hypothetical protein
MDTTVVQVRDVPVDVVATLKARAEARGQSLASYLRDLLAREAQVPPIEDVMADIASVSRSVTPSRICGRSPAMAVGDLRR